METLASRSHSWLSWFLRGILILGLLFLTARVVELQVIKGNYFRGLAENNRIRRVPISAPRGKILDRGGEVMVGNSEIKKRVVFNPGAGFEKILELGDANPEEIITEWKRSYLLGSQFAHASGYLGEVDEEELGKINAGCPDKGPQLIKALVGRTGLEQQYECSLRGIDGEELVEVDTVGRRVRTLGRREPIAGVNLQTTIDIGLQAKVAGLMEGKPGAVVITDTKGEILAFYSSPSFDPTDISQALEDEELPLFNRAIAGAFHPGSVFKIVTATAALQEEKIDDNFTYIDTGSFTIKGSQFAEVVRDFTYTNWYFTQYGRTEGEINLERAIARSTDTFFYKLGELLGVEALASWANKFGLGEPTGIDIPGEIAGLVPTPAWKKRILGERWFLGNTINMSIGQGDLAVTPIGVNAMTGVIASEGELCKPHFIGGESCTNLKIDKDTISTVKSGMLAACAAGGTAFPFFDFEPRVACKTGTAETGDEETTHAWFTVFGPAEFPELVATILIEEGGEGSKDAAPIAQEIFNYYFNP